MQTDLNKPSDYEFDSLKSDQIEEIIDLVTHYWIEALKNIQHLTYQQIRDIEELQCTHYFDGRESLHEGIKTWIRISSARFLSMNELLEKLRALASQQLVKIRNSHSPKSLMKLATKEPESEPFELPVVTWESLGADSREIILNYQNLTQFKK